MIKRIQSIKGLGVFQDYRRDNDLQDFSERNLIYGWNYSGKTTLSRLFSFLEKKAIPEEFAGAEFEVKLYGQNTPAPITHQNLQTCQINVRVFNSDFIADNLRYNTDDKKIQGIKFDVGENAITRKEIEDNIKFITDSRAFVGSNKTHTKKLEEFEGHIFTDTARHIKNDCFKSAIEFDKRHFKTIISQLDANNLDRDIISDDALLKSTQSIAIAQSNKEAIDLTDRESAFQNIFDEFVRILGYAPGQSVEDSVLSNNQPLYDWAKEGYAMHNGGDLKKCAFCGQQLTEDRMAFLNNFFTNQAALLKTDIQALKAAIEEEKNLIRGAQALTISPNDITEGLKERWIEVQATHKGIVDNYDKLLDELKTHLDDKYSTNLFVAIKVEIDTKANNAKNQWLSDVSQLVKQHNASVEGFSTIREENRAKYKRHLVASILKKERYFDVERKSREEATKNTEIQTLVKERETQNSSLLAQLKSIAAGKERLNEFIKLFLNRSDIQIDVTEDDYFVLKRGGNTARNLSEGEKTAIAFAYFIVMLESLERDGTLSQYIVFIDDPISSLDANHIAHVSALINSFFFRKATGTANPDETICKVRQLFVSTHNFEFHSFLRDAHNFKRNSKAQGILYVGGESLTKSQFIRLRHYMIKRNSAITSSIIELPKYLTKYNSEYVYLFSEIFAFYEAECPDEQNILMPNAVRRFLEMYTLTRLPGNEGEVDSRIKELVSDISELKILHHFSHFASFERVAKHNELIMRLPEIINDLFMLLSHDPQHYNSLLKAIGKTTPVAIPELEAVPV